MAKVLNQRDPRWKDILLGHTNDTTIGSHGCTITAIAMLAGLTPAEVNERLKATKGGYTNGNLVTWSKLQEAIPWLKFIKRVWQYDNADVKENLPCLVEVDGARIGANKHWVLYIGDGKMIDPWTGVTKATSYYPATGYAVVSTLENKVPAPPPPPSDPDAEMLPKRSVLYDFLSVAGGKTSDNEINAYLATKKNLQEIFTDFFEGNGRFIDTWSWRFKEALEKPKTTATAEFKEKQQFDVVSANDAPPTPVIDESSFWSKIFDALFSAWFK